MNMKKMLAVVAAASLVAVAAPAIANPFSDVPLNHWAYDAVETLTAKGIIEGYPDDTFRGNKTMTRYEIATVVARALANENAGGEDLEQLKALVVEFGPELEALGVKVDGFDARLARLEKGLSGWKISGQYKFDYYTNDEDLFGAKKDGFEFKHARLFLHRDMANGVSFDSRWHADNLDRYWMTAKDFVGIKGLTIRAGQFCIDWEGADGMYYGSAENDALFLDITARGIEATYSTGAFELTGFAGSNIGNGSDGVYTANASGDYYGVRAKLSFGEKAWVSANAFFAGTDDGLTTYTDKDENTTNVNENIKYYTYFFAAGFKPFDGLEIKGVYYIQDIEMYEEVSGSEEDGYTKSDKDYVDDPEGFRIILDVKQDLLKFTSLWVEYDHLEKGLYGMSAIHTQDKNNLFKYKYYMDDDALAADHDIIYAYAKQQWTPKIATYVEYEYADADGADDMTFLGIGAVYTYSPELSFDLMYGIQDGTCTPKKDYDNNWFRLRTVLNF